MFLDGLSVYSYYAEQCWESGSGSESFPFLIYKFILYRYRYYDIRTVQLYVSKQLVIFKAVD